LFHWCFRKKF